MVDGRFVLGAPNVFRECVKVAEFDSNGAVLSTHAFGDSKTRDCAYTALANGGLAGAFNVDPRPQNKLVFDVFCRMPGKPWFSQRLEFPPNTPSPLGFCMAAVEGSDGLICIFFMNDSSGSVGLMRLRPVNGALQLVDCDANFIPRGLGDLSCSGELPNIYAAADGDSILLGYQSAPDQFTKCPYRLIASRNSVVRVRPDKSKTLLATTPWWTPHIGFARVYLFPRPAGIYYAAEFQNIDTDCGLGWNVGLLKDGVFQTTQQLPEGRIAAVSRDGMLLFYTQPSNSSEIIKLRFRPEVKITRSQSEVIIDWDHAGPTDVLERSTDLKTWSVVPYTQRPVRLPTSGTAAFFRVKVGGQGLDES